MIINFKKNSGKKDLLAKYKYYNETFAAYYICISTSYKDQFTVEGWEIIKMMEDEYFLRKQITTIRTAK